MSSPERNRSCAPRLQTGWKRLPKFAGATGSHGLRCSALGTDFNPDTSDVDFLAEYGPPFRGGRFQQYMGLIQDLSDTLGRKVDVLRMDNIRNNYLQKAINESHEVIFDQTA